MKWIRTISPSIIVGTGVVLALTLAACSPSEIPSGGSPEGGTKEKRRVRIAAAADLKFAFAELEAALSQLPSPIEIQTTFGSSGNLYAQLNNRAPFDVFLSADRKYAQRLAENGHATASNVFDYATGRIVVWAHNGEKADRIVRDGITALASPDFKKISIANPEHAPYGVAAVAALEHYQLKEAVNDRLVLGENAAQSAEFARSGAADAGIIPISIAITEQMKDAGKYQMISATAHKPIAQAGAILNWAENSDAARDFVNFLTSERGQEILKRYGFDPPVKESTTGVAPTP